MSKRDMKLYLEDILVSIKRIESYTKSLSLKEFEGDVMTTDAVVRNLEIIGEAARNVPKEFRLKHVDVPWEKMVSMRNKVIHEYFGVDFEILWKTIHEDLPPLKGQVARLLKVTS